MAATAIPTGPSLVAKLPILLAIPPIPSPKMANPFDAVPVVSATCWPISAAVSIASAPASAISAEASSELAAAFFLVASVLRFFETVFLFSSSVFSFVAKVSSDFAIVCSFENLERTFVAFANIGIATAKFIKVCSIFSPVDKSVSDQILPKLVIALSPVYSSPTEEIKFVILLIAS